MQIVYTCPKCGHELVDIVLTSNPPIYKKECYNCGWTHAERNKIIKIPFDENIAKPEPTNNGFNNTY